MINHCTVREALATAAEWIRTESPPHLAAFISGSSTQFGEDAWHDPSSDIDCYLVVDGEAPAEKIGKITIIGVLLDVSFLSWESLRHAQSDAVLSSLLHFSTIVSDTDDLLRSRKRQISDSFCEPGSIQSRIVQMRHKIRQGLAADSSTLPQPEQIMNWLFPATLATHIPLIRACKPLTVRKRFLAAKAVMSDADYESLLSLYGFADVTAHQAQHWLDDTASIFNATSSIAHQSHRFWAGDLQPNAKDIAIGGSQQLINQGFHRESLYWIIATSARCLTLRNDAGLDSSAFLPAFTHVVDTVALMTHAIRATRSTSILSWIEEH